MRPIVWAVIAALFVALSGKSHAADQPPDRVPFRMELPPESRAWFRNPDGSCVQCSIGMCGLNQVGSSYLGPTAWSAASLLWDTPYGSRVRGGSYPSRVEAYAEVRHMTVYNVTGKQTFDWMRWAAKTGRFAAIGAGSAHFQTLYGWDPNGTPNDPSDDRWYVCNNNSPTRVDEYTWTQFQRLHLDSGPWIVVLDVVPPPANPKYIAWWR